MKDDRPKAFREKAKDDFTGWTVWSSSIIAARWVAAHTAEFSGRSVLELGSGCGLAGAILNKRAHTRRFLSCRRCGAMHASGNYLTLFTSHHFLPLQASSSPASAAPRPSTSPTTTLAPCPTSGPTSLRTASPPPTARAAWRPDSGPPWRSTRWTGTKRRRGPRGRRCGPAYSAGAPLGSEGRTSRAGSTRGVDTLHTRVVVVSSPGVPARL